MVPGGVKNPSKVKNIPGFWGRLKSFFASKCAPKTFVIGTADAVANISIKGGKAIVDIGVRGKIKPSFVKAVKETLRKGGAKSAEFHTGLTINRKLAAKLRSAARSGEKVFGGKVEMITDGPLPTFKIIFDPL